MSYKSAFGDGDGYLGEAILGDYPEKSEDRLTQTFAATFNHSPRFRKAFWKFLGRNPKQAATLRAITQQGHSANGVRSRLDTVLVNHRNRPLALIENKIEAPLFEAQLKQYSALPKFASVQKIALVKNYFDLSVPPGWKLFHWSDLHGAIVREHPNWPAGSDKFITGSFLKRLGDLRMARVSVIERDRLSRLARAVKAIKGTGNIGLSRSNIFETAADYVSMLEELIGLVRADPKLSKVIGKTARFNPWISTWGDTCEKDFWLGCYIPLRRKRNGIRSIGTGISFNSKNGRYEIESYVRKGDDWPSKDHGNHLVFDKFAAEALKFWAKKLT